MNTFPFKNYENYKLDGTNKDLLVDLCNDGSKKSHFRDSYSDFWVKMLQDSEYESLTTIAVNRLKMVDELMRGALEEQILPQIKK